MAHGARAARRRRLQGEEGVVQLALGIGDGVAHRGRELDVRALVRPACRVRVRVQTRVAQVYVHLAPPAVVAPAGRGVRRDEEQRARRVAQLLPEGLEPRQHVPGDLRRVDAAAWLVAPPHAEVLALEKERGPSRSNPLLRLPGFARGRLAGGHR
eukprot:scaffold54817_cov73-Phaeocystis_antarctica.AAC.10